MAKTISELRNQSIQVRDASAAGENTATRVGTVLNDIVGHIEDYENTQSSNNSSQDAKIEGVKSSLNAEIARAKTEESNLSTQIDTERTERQAAVSREETARIQADNDEKTARQQADNAEQDARIKADNDEKTARENADITLRTMIQTEVSNRQIAVKQEEIRAKAAEQANTQAIADETTRAKAEEERLQGEIDNTNTNLTTLEDKVNSNHGHFTDEVARLDLTDNEIKADLAAEKAAIIGTERIADEAVTTEKIANGSVTYEKLLNIIHQELGYDENATISQKQLTEVIDKIFYVLFSSNGKWMNVFHDENGNIAFAIDKKGESFFKENEVQFNGKLNKSEIIQKFINFLLLFVDSSVSGFVDNNGCMPFFADSSGVHLNKVISENKLGKFNIVDKSGNIGFAIDSKGRVRANLENYCKKLVINDISFTPVKGQILIPKDINLLATSAVLCLPSFIPYVIGQRMSIYYESILLYGWNKDYRIYSKSRGIYQCNQDEYNIYNESAGDKKETINLENSFGSKITSKDFVIHTADKSKAASYKVCVIGDSKSENSTKQAEVLNLCEKDGNLNVEFIGNAPKIGYDSDDNERTYYNCAKSGSGLSDWCCRETVTANGNPFYDSAVSSGIYVTQTTSMGTLTNAEIKFSIAKFIENIGETPDILWIDHGANQPSDEETKKCYDYIISDIKNYNEHNGTHIKIVISVQEAFCLVPKYETTPVTSTSAKNDRVKMYIDNYDNRQEEGIFICPQYLNVDLWHDFPTTLVYQNTRNKDATRRICLDPVHSGVNCSTYSASTQYKAGNIVSISDGLTRERNLFVALQDIIGVEPNDDKIHWAKATESLNSGYYKIADMYYATLRYITDYINN